MHGRDLKTSNILLTGEGIAKISDVGLATAMTAAEPGSWDRTTGTCEIPNSPAAHLSTAAHAGLLIVASCCVLADAPLQILHSRLGAWLRLLLKFSLGLCSCSLLCSA